MLTITSVNSPDELIVIARCEFTTDSDDMILAYALDDKRVCLRINDSIQGTASEIVLSAETLVKLGIALSDMGGDMEEKEYE